MCCPARLAIVTVPPPTAAVMAVNVLFLITALMGVVLSSHTNKVPGSNPSLTEGLLCVEFTRPGVCVGKVTVLDCLFTSNCQMK